jgi:hypothetical protein
VVRSLGKTELARLHRGARVRLHRATEWHLFLEPECDATSFAVLCVLWVLCGALTEGAILAARIARMN